MKQFLVMMVALVFLVAALPTRAKEKSEAKRTEEECLTLTRGVSYEECDKCCKEVDPLWKGDTGSGHYTENGWRTVCQCRSTIYGLFRDWKESLTSKRLADGRTKSPK